MVSATNPRADLGSLVDAAFPPGSRPASEVVHVEHHRPGDSADGQLSLRLEVQRAKPLDRAAAEADLRMPLHVEEIGAAEVSIAIGLACPESPRVDDSLDGSGSRVLLVEGQLAADVLEEAADVRDHHVARAEFRRRMPRLEDPLRHGVSLPPGSASRSTTLARQPSSLSRTAGASVLTTGAAQGPWGEGLASPAPRAGCPSGRCPGERHQMRGHSVARGGIGLRGSDGLDLVSTTLLGVRNRASGCQAVRAVLASFGTRGSQVQILSPRPTIPAELQNRIVAANPAAARHCGFWTTGGPRPDRGARFRGRCSLLRS